MKRVNITKDVRSREQISSAAPQSTGIVESKTNVEPQKQESDAKSEDVQRSETDTQSEQAVAITQKRGRKTTGNL